MSTGEKIDELLDKLKQQRDELHLAIKLGNLEVKQQWIELEKKLTKFSAQADRISDVAEDTGEQVIEAAKLAGEEIKKGYERIKRMI